MTRVIASASTPRPRRAADLAALVEPAAVALVGASEDPASFGNVAARNLLIHSEASCETYLITPRYASVLGRPAYATLDDLPEGVCLDVVLVLVPSQAVPGVLEQAARRKARYAVVFSGGFSEVGPSGRELEARLVSLARDAGMRIYGPNTPGFMRFQPRLGLTIQPGFKDDRSAGSIGLIAQSGGLGRCVLQASQRGLGFSYFFAPGNQIDLNVGDFVEFLAHDRSTRVIAALIEGIKDPATFVRGADAALAAGKPLVVLKLGRTEAGERAALSHTGSLAGSDRAFDAFCRSRNIVRVDDVDELIAVCGILSRAKRGVSGGVGIYGMSGGAGVLAVDALSRQGIEPAPIGETTRKVIAELTGSFVSVGNPVDMSGPALSRPESFGAGLRALAADPEVGPIMVLLNAWYAGHTERFANAVCEVDASVDNVVVPVWMSESAESPLAVLDAAGLSPARSVGLGARSLAAVMRYHAGSVEPPRAASGLLPGVVERISRILGGISSEQILEPDAKRVLAAAGISVTRERVAAFPDQATEVAAEIGYPVVLKAISESVVHREREGLVRLDLRSTGEVTAAYRDMLVRFTAAHAAKDWDGVLVSEMVDAGVDVFLGTTRDPAWGPLLAIGPGGAYADESDEVVLVALPATKSDIDAALKRTRLARSLARGARGAPMDVDALVDAVERLGSIALSFPELAAIDVNPIRVREAGRGAVVLDTFIHRASRGADESRHEGG